MLSLLKRKSPRKEIIQKLSQQSIQFTLEQKTAIILSLLALAKMEGYIVSKDFYYLEKLMELLQIEENSWRFKEVFDADTNKSIKILSSLDNRQKECFVIMLNGLLYGQKTPAKKKYVNQICEKTGINLQDYMGSEIDFYA